MHEASRRFYGGQGVPINSLKAVTARHVESNNAQRTGDVLGRSRGTRPSWICNT